MDVNVLPSIQELPEHVIHKIAAGEVVERPVSVVKELVENAIDAGATRIQVEVEQGGMKAIRVSDNGHGIAPQELSLALRRHATSKIRSDSDLFTMKTLGFRGEALPSIAGVSRFRIESATAGSQPVGHALEVREGKQSGLQEISMNRGTRVIVEQLFCTTPARLKFLKRPETEWGHIADLMTSLVLGHPEIEWRVTHNQKKFIHCPPASEPRRRILDVFGKDAMENLFPVERQVSELSLTGLISHPNFCQKTNRRLFIYVNGRYIQDRLVNHAIVSGYHSLLMSRQYPMVLLHLAVDPAMVDVNVHPTKREVRFSNSNAVHHLIAETIHRALAEAPWQKKPDPQKTNIPYEAGWEGSKRRAEGGEEAVSALPRPQYGEVNEVAVRNGVQRALGQFRENQLRGEEGLPDFPLARVGTKAFAALNLIGQFRGTYLVCEEGGSLILIDQHAAHERIGYEQLKKSHASGPLPQQKLLHPLIFDLPPPEAQRLRSCLKELENFGLIVEEFGENSFILKGHPTLIKNCDWVALLKELAENFQREADTQALESRIDHAFATMACHRQIRANHRLNKEEMEELLKQLQGTPRSYHCPHGRPVMVEIDGREIEKWFKRIL